VFAERLPDLVQPWSRISNRLLQELQALGLSASAEVSERLAPQLGMQVKAPTLLRYLRTIPAPSELDFVHFLQLKFRLIFRNARSKARKTELVRMKKYFSR
jgi:hypothetical protein